MSPDPQDPPRTSLLLRILLLGGGTLSLVLGVIGAFVPLLPTTPLVLLAAGCYARSWPPAHRWLRGNKFLGPICRSAEEGRYLPPRTKIVAVGLTLLSFTVTIVFALKGWPLRCALATLGLILLAWLLHLPSRPPAAVRVEGSEDERPPA